MDMNYDQNNLNQRPGSQSLLPSHAKYPILTGSLKKFHRQNFHKEQRHTVLRTNGDNRAITFTLHLFQVSQPIMTAKTNV